MKNYNFFLTVFQNQEKFQNSETVFEIQNESALIEEFEQLKKDHFERYLSLY